MQEIFVQELTLANRNFVLQFSMIFFVNIIDISFFFSILMIAVKKLLFFPFL